MARDALPPGELAKALARPGFTPGARDIPSLIALVEAEEPRAGAALAGMGAPARAQVTARIDTADEGGAARLVAVLGLFARAADGDARALLLAKVRDERVRVRRAAIVALGKLGALSIDGLDDVRSALVARWDANDVPADERRALAEALGKLGGDAARERLTALDASGDRELARRRDRALLMTEREARRGAESTIASDLMPAAPLRVRLGCRAGLAPLLGEELTALDHAGTQVRDDAVDVTLSAPWSTLFASRLWSSAAIRIAVPALRGATTKDALRAAIVDAIVAQRALLAAWTRGPIRWRLSVAGGHQRGLVWAVARDVTRTAPELINDPTQTTWDVRVDTAEGVLELVPRRLEDPRFAYRVAEVPAASHPTVAAALVWLSAPAPTDRVWDPFCGSGLELVERACRGDVATLAGSDVDADALAAARANLTAAGANAQLTTADARTADPPAARGVDAIITNPPLGSRVHVDAGALLSAALPHFASRLAAGGRLVWITPQPRTTSAAANAAGLTLVRSLPVDLGGVRGRMERWDRRE